MSTPSALPVEDVLKGFQGVDIEDIHGGVGLLGFEADTVLTCDTVLVSIV